MKKDRRVAFIFTSSREEIFKQISRGEMGDTPLRGMNYVAGADYFTIPSKTAKSLLFIPDLLRYDFIIAQDNLFLGYIVSRLAKLLRRRTKWLYMSINSSILIRRNAKRPLHLFFLKTFWNSYTRIMCISNEQIEDFVRIGIHRSHLIFVPFNIDANFFRPEKLSPEGDIVVSVGRDAGRDYPTLFKTAEKVPYTWIVAASKKNIPVGTPIPQNVSVHYDADALEVRSLFRRARLVVIVSKDSNVPVGSDCSGQTVILEALAAGLPVVATYRAWMKDYFVLGQDLVNVEPNDPDGLAQVVKDLWNDPERRKKLASSGHTAVLEKYTTEVMARHFENLFDVLS